MGADIEGWVEIRPSGKWAGAIRIGALLDRLPDAQRTVFDQSSNGSAFSLSYQTLREAYHLDLPIANVRVIDHETLMNEWSDIRQANRDHHSWQSWSNFGALLMQTARIYGAENVRLVLWTEYDY